MFALDSYISHPADEGPKRSRPMAKAPHHGDLVALQLRGSSRAILPFCAQVLIVDCSYVDHWRGHCQQSLQIQAQTADGRSEILPSDAVSLGVPKERPNAMSIIRNGMLLSIMSAGK